MGFSGTTETKFELDHKWLNNLIPIKELQPDERQKLAIKSRQSELNRGHSIEGSDEYRWLVYLLDGQVEISEKGKETVAISCESKLAMQPLFHEKSHNVHAVAKTQCRIVRFDRQYFNTLVTQGLLDGEEVETTEVNESEGLLFNSIMHAFNQRLLELPSLPEIALKIKAAINEPDVNIEKLIHIIEADPAIAARLIQVANSPLSRGVADVKSIRAAVVRLGLSTTRDLIFCLSIKQLFKSKSPLLRSRMKILYEHSIEVAAIAYVLAQKQTHLIPDNMLLAGLVHDIGVIPILTHIEKTGLEIEDEAQLEQVISRLRTAVGSMVISNWSLPNELVTMVENVENWERNSPGQADVCDVILVAQLYNRLQHHQLKDLPELHHVPAFSKIFPGKKDPELIKNILEQAHEEVHEVMSLLRI